MHVADSRPREAEAVPPHAGTAVTVPIIGLGPHGERATTAERLKIDEEQAAQARILSFTVAIVMHTTESDWARQHLAGIVATLGFHGAKIAEVVDCAFNSDAQVKALERLIATRPDAIISLPIANSSVVAAHRAVTAAGIKLVLIDNAPSSLLPGRDYVSLVSADNFGLGQIAARLLSPHVANGGVVGITSFHAEFFVAVQRDIAFRKWMAAERPDIRLVTIRFKALEQVGAALRRCLDEVPDLAGVFAVWDTPAIEALAVLRAQGRVLPMTTIDLGIGSAMALAEGDVVKGIAAQQPYEQGIVVAEAVIVSLVGGDVPAWLVLPALEVTRERVVATYQRVWSAAAPEGLVALAK